MILLISNQSKEAWSRLCVYYAKVSANGAGNAYVFLELEQAFAACRRETCNVLVFIYRLDLYIYLRNGYLVALDG